MAEKNGGEQHTIGCREVVGVVELEIGFVNEKLIISCALRIVMVYMKMC